MTTAGPNYAGTIASDSAVGSIAWSNISNMGAADTNYATVAPGSSGTYTSYYAKLTNFGFSLPSNATIDGITVEINRRCDQNGVRYTLDAHVKLIKAGTIGATNKADTTNKWPTTLTVKSYGGSADLWSDTWTYSDINNSGFGVAFSCAVNRAAQSATAYVDYVRVTVTYTVGGTTYTQSVSGSLTAAGVLTVEMRKNVAGTATTSGALGHSVGKGVAGALTGSGVLMRMARKGVSGSVTGAGALATAKTIIALLSGSVAAAGGLVKRVGRAVSGSVSGAGTVGRVTRKAANGQATASGALGKTARKGLTGSVTVTGLLAAIRSAGMYFVNLAGSLTATGALGRMIRKPLDGQSQAQGIAAKRAGTGLAGSVTPTGALARLRSYLLSIGGNLTAVGSVTKRADIAESGMVESSGALVKRINKSLAGLLTALGNLLARLPGGVHRGFAHVGDRAVNALVVGVAARWVVDVTDLAAGSVGLIDRTACNVTAGTRPIYTVTVSDSGGLTG